MLLRPWHVIPVLLSLVVLSGGGFALGSVVGAPPSGTQARTLLRTVKVRARVVTQAGGRVVSTTVTGDPRTRTVRRAPRTVTVTTTGTSPTVTVAPQPQTRTRTQTQTQTQTVTTTSTVTTTVVSTATTTVTEHSLPPGAAGRR